MATQNRELPTEKMMMSGLLEVMLLDANSLKNTETFGKMDPYVLVLYKGHKLKTKVARGQGRNPVWNDKLTFWVQYPEEEDQYNLTFRIKDEDCFVDDFVGEVGINVREVVALGVKEGKAELQPRNYNVLRKSKASAGELRVGFTFTLKNFQLALLLP